MSKHKMFEKALKRWEFLSTDGPSIICSFCTKYHMYCPDCELLHYDYACLEPDSPWKQWMTAPAYPDDQQKAFNMHMLIQLISLSEGYEVY